MVIPAFVIVLEQSELGRNIGQEALAVAKTHGVDLQVHPGVLGYQSRSKFEAYGITQFLNYTIIDRPGHQGCFLSHFELWQKCVDLDQPIIILEHDGMFVRPLPDDVLDHFDDILRLDPYATWKPGYNELVEASLSQPIDYWVPPTECHWHSSGDYYVGAYGYIIKPNAARKLIKHAQERGAVCTEAHIGSKIVDIKSTTATVVRIHPHYIGHGVEFSTTFDLNLAVKGQNQMSSAKYVSPKKYQELYGN